ncbi:hypothetical protein PCANC_26230 [Puccinia coronata f. sp. avenae]|uniref:Uncharacterized protein n=1 Tax=Puccinia coronata f. sp. avenae TaxID=200324 RepID=A0A2N5S5M7_9BASI|nr:hypothetical protein PCANC_26230 [Puccinia coronata f. sp. avenae]
MGLDSGTPEGHAHARRACARPSARPKGMRTPIRTPNKHGVQPLHAPLERRAGAARHSQHAARPHQTPRPHIKPNRGGPFVGPKGA